MKPVWLRVLGLSACIALCVGCSRNVDPKLKVKTVPFSGRMIVDGHPANGASLFFFPKEMAGSDVKTPPPHLIGAAVDENGDFNVQTNGLLKGAPIGTYLVGLSWNDPSVEPDRDGDSRGRQLIPAKFLNPRTSGIEVEVSESNQSVSIAIKIEPSNRSQAQVLVSMQ